MSKFFINRPIFAIVISLMITIIGILAMVSLPIARYPNIAPPQVRVNATYIGASSQVVSDTVAAVIEQQIVGVQDMDYMVSSSGSDGSYSLTVQFDQGTDADMATVNTQNRVARATASLPSEVQAVGVTTTKSSGDMAMVFALVSPNETYDQTFLKNYGSNFLLDELKSVNGVGTVQEFGADYAMRVWLNPAKMSQYGVTIAEVTSAISGQNVQAAAGQIGASPAPGDQQFQYTLSVQGRMSSPEEFGSIVIKKDSNDNLLYLRDISRIELGAKSYGFSAESMRKPSAGFAISLTTDANALETISEIKKILEEQSKSFPADMEYRVVVDSTAFVTASIKEVIQTFIEALLLVGLIVYIFLQSWRSTIIPMIAVPVSLLGTFAAFTLLDFSINTLTLFAMVLAIGLVVDDAIVVIEAVEFELKYNGKQPKEATVIAMENVSGPVIGIAFVLASVFIPVSFMGGMTGILYKQFALTIAVSVAISAFVALSLTPALCAMMLKPHVHKEEVNTVEKWLNKFNVWFDKMTDWYGFQLVKLSRRLSVTVIALLVLAGLSGVIFKYMPTAFVPAEDSGYYMIAVNLPEGSTTSRTLDVVRKISAFVESDGDTENIMGITGFDILSGGQKSSGATAFVLLNDWSERKGADQGVRAKIRKAFGFAAGVPEATILALNPPSIPGLGNTGGLFHVSGQ